MEQGTSEGAEGFPQPWGGCNLNTEWVSPPILVLVPNVGSCGEHAGSGDAGHKAGNAER